MAYVWWEWRTRGIRYDEMVVDFTIHNDVDLRGPNGLYLMLGYSDIADVPFYFGLQTDVYTGEPPYFGRGKGVIFSRWDTRDLAHARWDPDQGWSQSSGHEGDFIGVRRSYDWGAGDYRVRLAPTGESGPEGLWYGLWIIDRSSGVETWVGSLRFPRAGIAPRVYSTAEVYGRPIRPIDIPRWHVSIQIPMTDGKLATSGVLGYTAFHNQIKNADVRYDRATGAVHLEVGGLTEQVGRPGRVVFR